MEGGIRMEFKVHNTKIIVIKGDITTFKGDAIVNSAHTSLLKGSGICGVIYKKAGVKNLYDFFNGKTISYGESILSPAFKLDCKYIIHTSAPKWENEENCIHKLENCYKSIIGICENMKIESLAIPCIGMGIYGTPINIGVKVAIDTVLNYMSKESSLKYIYFVCYNDLFEQMYNKYLSINYKV